VESGYLDILRHASTSSARDARWKEKRLRYTSVSSVRDAQYEMLGTSRSVYGLELLPEEVGRM
jgi:hypothetical protein